MNTNRELDFAWDFVNNTDRNLFLTGKAGTGKTTFLHKLKINSLKRMVVVAPTGIAAINAKGTTIHSFFQLPFGPILPNELKNSIHYNRKFTKTKINIIKSLDLLVIDEISMVRADLLDGIDSVLRQFRNKNLVFGGVQVLMIGDLQQLSPVIKENEWQLLKPFYDTAYFFSSISFKASHTITIELKKIYRQDNPQFITILNEIRTNTLSQSSTKELNKRFIPDFTPNPEEGYISLTTHNNKAEQINNLELEKIDGLSKSYFAKIEGKFPEFSYPNKEELVLKVGAQVMFIKNDSSLEKRYFNGKIGKVILLDDEEIIVKCPDDDFNIVVTPEIWENINYTIDAKSKAIKAHNIGSYTQMPLRLAWSITIHKSQGLTFDKAIIDLQGAFAHGQTYVALSRCKSLEGLILKSKIDSSYIISDSKVSAFNKNAEENQSNEVILKQSKIHFQLHLISEIFDYYMFLQPVNRILDIYYNNKGSIEGQLEAPLIRIKETVTNLLKVANGFKSQLLELSQLAEEPQHNTVLQKRFKKGVSYFNTETELNIYSIYKTLSFTTDNQMLNEDIHKQLDAFEEYLTIKQLYFKGLDVGFSVDRFLDLRAKSVFITNEKPKKQRNMGVEGTAHTELFERLRELRHTIAERENLIHYQIFNQKTLYDMCEALPTNKNELKLVKGMGKIRIDKYGDEIIDEIKTYCDENNIGTSSTTEIFNDSKPKRVKGDTKKVSLLLFKSGKSVDEIAHIRHLNSNTIVGHLASYMPSGEVKITDLISEDHYNELKDLIPKLKFENLSDIKHQIDEKYSYSDIRLVLSSFE